MSEGKGSIYSVFKVGLWGECFSDREKLRRSPSEEREGGLNMGHVRCPPGDVHYTVLHTHVRMHAQARALSEI